MSRSISELRQEYMRQGLDKRTVAADPLKQFRLWFDDAVTAGIAEPNAMILATANKEGRPSARAVLLKACDEHGFVFFTNYESRKARELEENPWAALTFVWLGLERQVRIEGQVERTTDEESAQYYLSRPVGSRLGAWASRQSEVISDRGALERSMEEMLRRFEGQEIPRPPYWGGYRVKPSTIEFWQGRPNRLHDRLRYSLLADGWRIDRLSP